MQSSDFHKIYKKWQIFAQYAQERATTGSISMAITLDFITKWVIDEARQLR